MAAAPSSPGSLSLQGVCPIHGRAGYRSSEAVGRPLDSLHQAASTVAWTHPERGPRLASPWLWPGGAAQTPA